MFRLHMRCSRCLMKRSVECTQWKRVMIGVNSLNWKNISWRKLDAVFLMFLQMFQYAGIKHLKKRCLNNILNTKQSSPEIHAIRLLLHLIILLVLERNALILVWRLLLILDFHFLQKIMKLILHLLNYISRILWKWLKTIWHTLFLGLIFNMIKLYLDIHFHFQHDSRNWRICWIDDWVYNFGFCSCMSSCCFCFKISKI